VSGCRRYPYYKKAPASVGAFLFLNISLVLIQFDNVLSSR
jgi:hypothetical protein